LFSFFHSCTVSNFRLSSFQKRFLKVHFNTLNPPSLLNTSMYNMCNCNSHKQGNRHQNVMKFFARERIKIHKKLAKAETFILVFHASTRRKCKRHEEVLNGRDIGPHPSQEAPYNGSANSTGHTYSINLTHPATQNGATEFSTRTHKDNPNSRRIHA
jgi:hypothetical protein